MEPVARDHLQLPPVLAAVRRSVFASFAADGQAPSPAAIAHQLGHPVGEILDALRSLHDGHHLVLVAAGDAVRMAHPFSASPMGFVVLAARDDRMWWGGCAWDSFGIVAAVGEELEIRTRCPHCERPLAFRSAPEIPPPGLTVRVPRPAAEWWEDVVGTCTHIRLFCDDSHARQYVVAHDLPEGALVPATTMWQLALSWYADRLDSNYVPQTASERQRQLDRVGLDGDFWRLP